MITQNLLQQRFEYDAETGIFRYRNHVGRHSAGSRAGTLNRNGYRCININGKSYLEHRLAWLYVTGAFPAEMLDHIDRNKTNNQFNNLRQATRAENRRNGRARGFFERNGKYYARATIGKEQTYLGSFDSPNQAHAAFRQFSIENASREFQYTMS